MLGNNSSTKVSLNPAIGQISPTSQLQILPLGTARRVKADVTLATGDQLFINCGTIPDHQEHHIHIYHIIAKTHQAERVVPMVAM